MKKRSGFAVMARLIGLVKPLSGYMSLAVLMGLVGHLCAAFITIFGGYGVLAALRFEVPFTLTTVFISVLVFALLRGFLRYAEQACNHFIAFKLLALLRDRVFRALRKLCPAKLEGRDKGDLISVITSDIELLEVFYAHTISPAAIALLFTIVMCLFIGSFHWILGVIALAAYLIVGIVIPIVISRCSGDDGLRFRTRSGELSGFVLDSLRGLSEILQYGQGKKRLSKMNEKTDELSRDEDKMNRTAGRNTAVTNTVVLTFDLIMLFASALLYQRGAVDFDGVLIPTQALFSSIGPVNALAALGSTLQNTFAAGNRVLDILDETPVVEEITGKPEITFSGAKAEQVSFSYGNETILSDVSVTIPENAVVGIVGRSGSGKSTLLRLIAQIGELQYDGRILYNGHEIRTIPYGAYYERICPCFHEPYLFYATLEDNICVGRPIPRDIYLDVIRKLNLEYLLDRDHGQELTPERMETLSGGERQRVALARAGCGARPAAFGRACYRRRSGCENRTVQNAQGYQP